MKELLQEIVKWMDETLNKSGHSNMEALMLLDDGRALLARITAALAEPEPDVELASDIEYGFVARYGSLTADGKTKDKAMQELARVILAAFNSEPEPDAMELVDQLAAIINSPFDTVENRKAKAASLIADFGRRVPRAFVEEILDKAWNCLTNRPEEMVLQTIADKYGVQVEE